MASVLTNWEVYILEPEERTNLVTNPSIESATTGYTAVNSTLAVSTAQFIRGLASLRITPSSTSEAGAYWTHSCTSGQAYSFGVDVLGEAGKTYTLRITNASDVQKATVSFVGTGFWQRKHLSFIADATASFRFKVLRDGGQSTTAAFYADGWQVEAASTPSSYIDGDSDALGFGFLRDVAEYRWNGTAHASTSTRTQDTRSGGTYTRIRDWATISRITGLGLTGYDTVSTEMVKGGGIYQWSREQTRRFAIELEFDARTYATNPGRYHEAMSVLQNALNPSRMKYPQPLRLVVVGYDADGVECTERLLVDCMYTSGLEGVLEDYYSHTATLTFEQYEPRIKQDGTPGKTLAYNEQRNFRVLASVNLYDGQWSDEGIVSTGGSTDSVFDLVSDNNGGYYIGGTFTSLNGVTGIDGIARRTANGTWSALTGFPSGGDVFGMAYNPKDNYFYIGGDFLNAGGDANADYICKWNGSTFSAVSTAYPNNYVLGVVVTKVGNVYIYGEFTAVGTVPNTSRIAKWNGSSWTSVATAPSTGNILFGIPDPYSDDGIIIGGTFQNLNGSAALDYLARYDGSSWSLIGSAAPNSSAGGSIVYDDKTGRLYVCGAFTSIGGISAAGVAYWDGNNWHAITGFTNISRGDSTVLADGTVVFPAGWGFGSVNANFGAYNGSVRIPFDAYFGTGSTGCVYYLGDTNKLILTGDLNSVGNTYIPGVTSIVSEYGDTYPTVILRGGGMVWAIRNYTTAQSIYFDGLTLLDYEIVYLSFRASGIHKFWSNARGNMMRYIAPGSSPTFRLVKGVNNISLFMYGGTSGNTSASIRYLTGYQSLDKAVLR